MMLDPDVMRLFTDLAAAGAKPLAALTVEQARAFYNDKSEKYGGATLSVAEVRDFRSSGPAGDIPLRLYRPEGVTAPGPAMIYLHGGGFVIGGFASHDKVCRAIAAQTPCRVIAVDYRLAPENPFPAGLEDVLAASAWIAEHAPELGIGKDRIAIGGDSAGGNLSAVTCLHARDSGPRFRAQVLIYPSTDLKPDSTRWPSRLQNAQVPPLTADSLHWFRSRYLPHGGSDFEDWRLSPLHADSLAHLPPALVLTAGFDPLRDEGKAYADRLRESGVETVYKDYPAQIHGFIEFGGVLGAASEAIGEIAEFLRSHL